MWSTIADELRSGGTITKRQSDSQAKRGKGEWEDTPVLLIALRWPGFKRRRDQAVNP